MGWSGSWNDDRTVYSGTYTAADGSVFTGTWTAPSQGSGSPDPWGHATPPDYDPYVGPGRLGPRADNSDSTRRTA